ncbi:MAG: ComEC/Rec2 family competence protein [Clostridia bacterium]|nr:ComEC/Rec2 family competence protein [Clostridia bacterium]
MEDGSGYVKRPLLLIGAVFFVTLWFLTSFRTRWMIIAAPAAVFAVGAVMLCVHKARALTIFLTFLSVAAACLCFMRAEKEYSFVISTVPGHDRNVVGQVYEKQYLDDGARCEVRVTSVDGVETNFKMTVDFPEIAPEKIEKFVPVSFHSDISDFESKNIVYINRLRSDKIYASGICFQDQLKIEENEQKDIIFLLNQTREKISKTITDFLPNDNGRLIAGFVLGDKSELSEKTQNDFRVCGISHLLAVSGLHVYTWSNALFLCLAGFLSRRKSAVISIAFTVFFMALTGFTPSVVRAGIMMILVYAGMLFMKVPDSLNSLGAGLVIMLAANPYSLHSIGLQLSFSAAIGLSVMNEKILQIKIEIPRHRRLSAVFRSVLRSAAVCAVATAATIPVLVFSIGKLSLLCVITNLLCVDLSMFAMIIGGVGAVLSVFRYTSFLGLPTLIVAGFLAKIIISISSFFGRFDFLYIDIDSDHFRVCSAVLIIAGALMYFLKPDFFKNKLAVVLAAVNLTAVSAMVMNIIEIVKEVR